MRPKSGPVFVERSAYRRRRLIDASRLLPILGLTLVCLPLLWTGARDTPTSTTYAMIYFFGLWLALVIGAAILSRHLKTPDKDPEAAPDPAKRSVDGPPGGG